MALESEMGHQATFRWPKTLSEVPAGPDVNTRRKKTSSLKCRLFVEDRTSIRSAAPETDALHRSGSGDRRQQARADERRLAGPAHAVDQEERGASRGLLLQPLPGRGDGPGAAEEQVRVLVLELSGLGKSTKP